MNNKWMFLSASTLKIIAMILMVIDHIGYQFYRQLGEYYEVFRIFGRLSLPIFAYLITDGMIHSRNKIKYILQMFCNCRTVPIKQNSNNIPSTFILVVAKNATTTSRFNSPSSNTFFICLDIVDLLR